MNTQDSTTRQPKTKATPTQRTTYEVELNITMADVQRDAQRRAENERQIELYGDVLFA